MATSKQKHDGERSVKPLAIGYLVWHCVSSAALVVLLVICSMAYAGAFPSVTQLSSEVFVFGASVSVWILIVVAWVVVCSVSVIGVLFGAGALLARTRPGTLAATVKLARAMVVVCALDVVYSLLQQNVVSVLASIVSLGLTLALSLEIRRAAECADRTGELAEAMPKRSLAAEAASGMPSREGVLDPELKGLFGLVRGYTTTMLVWGSLRSLSGLSALFSTAGGGQGALDAPSLAAALLIVASGVYLFVVGRLGHSALAGGSRLRSFFLAGIVGLCISGLMLVAALVVSALGVVSLLHGTSTVCFCLALDCALYITGCVYASKLHKQLPCELCELGNR